MYHLFSLFLKTYFQAYYWALNTVLGKSPVFNSVILNKGMDHLFSTYGEGFINQIQIYGVYIKVFFSFGFFQFHCWETSQVLQSFAFLLSGWSSKPFFFSLKVVSATFGPIKMFMKQSL